MMDRSIRFTWICLTRGVVLAMLVILAATAGRADDGKALPSLVPIRDLLADVNAPARRQVMVRGVVTWRGYTGLIIQDDSAGIWIDTLREEPRPIRLMVDPEVLDRLAPGQEVEVVGCTNRGGYSPNVFAETIRILGVKPEPEPRPVDQHRFFSGADDCQRVTVRGLVQGVRDGRIDWLLVTADGADRFTAVVSKRIMPQAPEHLVDAEVQIVGVAATYFNTRGEHRSSQLLIAGADDITVERAAPGPPFAAPEVPLHAIAEYRPDPADGHRIRTQGTVTFAEPGKFLYLQEGTLGVRVETASAERIAPGDQVEVAGFVDGQREVAGMVEAVIRRIESGRPLAPIRIMPDEIVAINKHASYHGAVAAPGDYKGCLVVFPARVIDVQAAGDGGLVLLQSGSTSVVAVVQPEAFRTIRRLEPGSEVMATGIVREDATAQAAIGRTADSRPFGQLQLLLRSAADMRLVRAPSWWKPHRLAAALAAVAAVAGIATGWVVLLRRQVRRQLDLIETKLQAEAAVDERHRIAREFHDTLEQDLAGITLQLDAAAHRAGDEHSRNVLEEQRGLLARLRSETHDFLWDLRDPARHDGSLLESVAAQAAYLRSLTTVPIRLDSSGDLPRVSPLVQYHILRIMREAVNNALKYADATVIDVRLAAGPDGLCLNVADDGRGFDVATRDALEGHFGIRGMRERARRIEATIAIESRSGRGTRVAVVVPPGRLAASAEGGLSESTMAGAVPAGDDRRIHSPGGPG
jgi:signal transduction histidine kinase